MSIMNITRRGFLRGCCILAGGLAKLCALSCSVKHVVYYLESKP